MVPGRIRNDGLHRDIVRLKERFRTYCDCYPFGLWDTGLAVTGEMRAITELYLPMEQISRAFNRLLALALRYPPKNEHTLFAASATWLDVLQRLDKKFTAVNPAHLLEMLAATDNYRIRFLFALLLPRHHGNCFRRYPAQLLFLEKWLHHNRETRGRKLRFLDAACGTGEGVYDLALLLRDCGIPVRDRVIHGCSLEPLELFAAAHGFFPHDPERDRLCSMRIKKLVAQGEAEGLVFFRDDVSRPPHPREEPYDVVLCNGLLGGPFIHGADHLTATVASLALRIRPGGMLLAADRFHGGWKKEVPQEVFKEMLQREGFRIHPIEDGIAAEKDFRSQYGTMV